MPLREKQIITGIDRGQSPNSSTGLMYPGLMYPGLIITGFHEHDSLNMGKLMLYVYTFIVYVFTSTYPSREKCTICKYAHVCMFVVDIHTNILCI